MRREIQRPSFIRVAVLAAVPVVAWACNADEPTPAKLAAPAVAAAPSATGQAATATAPAAAAEHPGGIEHLRRWSDRIIQGGQPGGDAGFREVAALGATTVISVDGAVPDVEGAAKFGLKYVHVPIGYDGIGPDEQLRIIKAVTESKGPVFIHCHHGLHRGPAAAAIARIAIDGVSEPDAYQGLKDSGCSPSYDGLYETVKTFVIPSPEQLAALPPLPSAVKPQGMQDAMVHVDERWDYFKALKAAKWSAPADAPDKTPAHELTILRELFKELDRLDESKAKGDAFLKHSAAIQVNLDALQTALAADDAAASAKAFELVAADCKSCHADFRD